MCEKRASRAPSRRPTPEAVWDALADWGALHTRLAPGFVADTQVAERFIARDDELRRLSWTAFEGPYTHHNGSGQVSRWTAAGRGSSERRHPARRDGGVDRGDDGGRHAMKQALELRA
ncbi:MAG TPA: hypothetical protein VFG42_23915 [Baekduia sp.]|uniref:hypothetical protein n=1 Tax=Baekduia sp. TaxID=2600305 RepID=UPI002D78EFB7|nr:hypothetical protein [Baekduia sp.]HET6509860.1 hypothetical protein [Baekduia sp.]